MKKPSGTFYRHILADAWGAVKSAKVLWLLGFFVSFLGNGGVYELLIQGTGRLGLRQDFGGAFAMAGILPSGERFAEAVGTIGGFDTAVALLIGLTVLAMLGLAVWVVVSAQGGLIAGLRDALKGRKVAFGEAFSAGAEVFWPLFTLNLFSRLAVMSLFYLLLALLVLLLAKATLLSSLAYLVGFLVAVPLTVVIGFITIYAACYVTIHRLTFIQALDSALALFRRYWLVSLEMAVILFVINVLVAFVLGAIMGAVGLALLPFIVGASLLQSGPALGAVLALAAVAAVAVLAIVGSGLAAFQYAAWVALFGKLHAKGHGGVPKIVRWFERLLG